jgi:hypothetical protein
MALVYAIYQQSRIIVVLLAGTLIVENITMLVSLVLSLPHTTYTATCVSDTTSPILIGTGFVFTLPTISLRSDDDNSAPPMIVDLFLLLLAVVKCLRLSRGRRGNPTADFLRQLMQDGTWAFLAVFVVFATNSLCWLLLPNVEATTVWLCVLLCSELCSTHAN